MSGYAAVLVLAATSCGCATGRSPLENGLHVVTAIPALALKAVWDGFADEPIDPDKEYNSWGPAGPPERINTDYRP
jgi:hypothetical protein